MIRHKLPLTNSTAGDAATTRVRIQGVLSWAGSETIQCAVTDYGTFQVFQEGSPQIWTAFLMDADNRQRWLKRDCRSIVAAREACEHVWQLIEYHAAQPAQDRELLALNAAAIASEEQSECARLFLALGPFDDSELSEPERRSIRALLTGGSAPALRKALSAIVWELSRAVVKFPSWPTDVIHAAQVVQEECGELGKAALESVYEPEKLKPGELCTEAMQTGAMAVRFLISLEAGAYSYYRAPQHSQLRPQEAGAAL